MNVVVWEVTRGGHGSATAIGTIFSAASLYMPSCSLWRTGFWRDVGRHDKPGGVSRDHTSATAVKLLYLTFSASHCSILQLLTHRICFISYGRTRRNGAAAVSFGRGAHSATGHVWNIASPRYTRRLATLYGFWNKVLFA